MISARTSSVAMVVSLILIGVSGCVIDDIDPANRRCPCIAGWVCDEASDRCVEADAGDVVPGDADVLVDAYVPVDAPPPPPTCELYPEAIFCDDFESGDLTQWQAVEPAAGGSITASMDAAHSGTHGLRLSGSAGVMRLTATIETADVGDSALYFRAWFRVNMQTAGTLNIFELFAETEGSVAAQMVLIDQHYRVRIAATGMDGVSRDGGRPDRWEPATWECVRGRVIRADTDGEVQIFDTGPPHQQAILTGDTDWGTSYDTFKITLEGSEAGLEIDLDDIVWAREPLLCP